MSETQTRSSKSLAEQTPVEDRSWPPQPPWGEPPPEPAKAVAEGLASVFGGIPLLLLTMISEARYHFRLKLK